MLNSDLSLYQSRLDRANLTSGLSSNAIYNQTLALIEAYGIKGAVLEFGAGSGTLIQRLCVGGRFDQLVGIDILARPATLNNKVEWVQTDLNHPTPLPEQTFDLVISTEVIEHLENPRAVTREWFRLLKPGGLLILTTPNQESLRSYCGLIFGGHYVAFLGPSYPAHITALLRLDIERMLIESGFQPPQFHYTNSGGIPKMPFVSWQSVSLGLLKGRLWSDNLLAVSQKPFGKKAEPSVAAISS